MADSKLKEILPAELPRKIRSFHRQLPGYRMSPLKGLSNLAAKLGLGGIWVKDESARLDLRSFKVLGGSYAIYKLIQKRLGLEDQEISFADLSKERIGRSWVISPLLPRQTEITGAGWPGPPPRWDSNPSFTCIS